jgi:peptide/nickel transport system substrate-binding protein
MLKIRYILRLTRAFISRFKGLIFVGIFFGILSFFFFRFVGPSFLGKKVERIGITGRFRVDNLPQNILELIGDGLTYVGKDGIVEPNLAASWETADKGKTWTFHLKEGLTWQDGKRLTSQTINYQFSDVEVEKPDQKTIIFKLKESFTPFPTVVSKPIFKKGLLGTGDWKVIKASLAGSYVQTLILQNDQKFKKVYKFYPTEERAKLAYKLGQVDTLIDVFNPQPFESWKNTIIKKEIKTNQIVTVFFNTQDKLLSEKSLRQALNYAIDKQGFNGERAISPISPNSWAYNPQVKQYNYNPQRARDLLGDLDQKDELEIKLVSSPILLPVAEKIADYWQTVGIKTVVQVSSVIPSQFQAYLAILDIPKDPDQYSIWHSTQGATNISKFQNPRIDKLLEDGRVEVDMEERKKIYLDFQRFITEELPAAFLYHPTTYDILPAEGGVFSKGG